MASLVLGTVGSIVGGMVGGPVGASVGYLIGSTVGSLIDPPKVEGPKLSDLKLQHSTYGAVIPKIYGTKRVAGNVIWQTDLEEHKHKSGGKGGPQVTTYTYTASWAVSLGVGPILGIRNLWGDGRLLISNGEATDNLQFVLYLGTETQLPDPTIEATEGVGEVNANRGQAYIVFTDVELTDYGNRIFQSEVEVEATGTSELQRISTFSAIGAEDTWIGVSTPSLMGAIIDGNQVIQYAWESRQDTSETAYYERRWNLQTGAIIDTTVPIVALVGTHILMVGYNSPVAFMGVTGGGIGYWMWGGAVTGPCNPPPGMTGGSPEFFAITSRPLLLDNFYYAAGGQGGFEAYIAKWGVVDGLPHPTPEFEVVDLEAISVITPVNSANWCLTASDDGFLYSVGPGTSSSNAQMLKIDPDTMTVVYHWTSITDGLLGTRLQSASGPISTLTIYKNHLAIMDKSTAPGICYLYRINDDYTFTEIDSLYPVAWHSSNPPTLSLEGGYILTEDGVLRMGSFEILGNIVADISDRCGLGSGTSAQYDVSDLTERVYGYVLASQMTGKNAIDPLRAVYQFDGAEVDDAMLFVHRDLAAVAAIDDDDLGVHDLGAQVPPLLEHTRTPESELPRTVNLVYVNPDTDYQVATQYARREAAHSELDTSLNVPIVMADEEARQRVNAILYSAWVERTGVAFSLNRKWAALVPTDVVTIQGYRVRITSIAATVNGIIRCAGLITRGNTFEQASLGGGAPGGGFVPQLPGSGTKALTELVLLDIDPLSNDDSLWGFYAAMAPAGPGAWSGATLYKSLDGGVTYHDVAFALDAATIGHATTVLPDEVGSSTGYDPNTVEVLLHDTSHTLESTNDEGITNGMNKAALRAGSGSSGALWEIFQFKTATLLSTGLYELSDLVRGVNGTEAFMAGHSIGNEFVMLDTVVNVPAPASELNLPFWYKAVTSGNTLVSATPVEFTNTGDLEEPGGSGPVSGPGGPGTGTGTSTGDAFVPYYIAPGETFTVPIYKQALFAMTIDNEGVIANDGYLLWVD